MKRPADEGFTLVELMVAVAILGIVMGAITAATIVGLRTTDETSTRLSESHNAQMASTFFAHDVASASDVSLTDTACSGGATVVVRFAWSEYTTAAGTSVPKVASYVVEHDAAEKRLVRRLCAGAGVTLVGSVAVVHFPLSVANPVIACDLATPGTCPSATPTTVTLSMSEASTYRYAVSGTRRTT
jgi:prepilin-type N-terminal cleavage/methylation domain-containing protein